MKKRIFFTILILGLVFSGFSIAFSAQNPSEGYVCAVYFTGVGCPHCANTDAVVLENLPNEHPNVVVIEYEIYQQSQNAPLLYEYNESYDSGLGIPLMIFGEDNYMVGDRPILRELPEILKQTKQNKCALIDGSGVDFNDLDITSLPGSPKIWKEEKILIKLGPKGDNELLKKLLNDDNLNETLKGVEFVKIQPVKVPLSGKNVQFENAVSVGNWIFQWNGPELKILPSDGGLPAGETTSPGEVPEIVTKLTLAKILSLAAVDAVNPCALAVLSLMLIAILSYNPNKRRNVLLAGLAFVISVFIMYLIYGLIIIKSFQLIQALTSIRIWLYKILGLGAIILGCFKLKAFFGVGVCKVSPRVNKIISKVTSPKGAFLVGAFVTIFLLPCTIGPYIICGGILSAVCLLKSLPWLLLYNLIFVLPMLAAVLIIYLGLGKIEDISRWQAKNMKYLDLVSGIVILGLGIAMFLGWV